MYKITEKYVSDYLGNNNGGLCDDGKRFANTVNNLTALLNRTNRTNIEPVALFQWIVGDEHKIEGKPIFAFGVESEEGQKILNNFESLYFGRR